ncbi:MAG: hypothetical protein EOO29_32760, partial [Comamonadaceae bacterium]
MLRIAPFMMSAPSAARPCTHAAVGAARDAAAAWQGVCAGVLLALCLLVPQARAAAPQAGGPPTVRTALGPLQGVWMEEGRVAAYLGVPFAQPPVGALRFQKAPAAAAWAPQTLQATGFKPACMQQGKVPAEIGMAEDCLYLNVYVPQGTQAKQATQTQSPRAARPVMVFVHGGRYWTGRASENAVQKLAREADAIVVTVAYRLNAFGFLGDPE